jgi:hypothetical protein
MGALLPWDWARIVEYGGPELVELLRAHRLDPTETLLSVIGEQPGDPPINKLVELSVDAQWELAGHVIAALMYWLVDATTAHTETGNFNEAQSAVVACAELIGHLATKASRGRCDGLSKRIQTELPRPERLHESVPMVMMGEPVEADGDLAPVLQLMWTAGIRTLYSCQGGLTRDGRKGPGYISFPSEDAIRVREVIGLASGIWEEDEKSGESRVLQWGACQKDEFLRLLADSFA